jgi:hypothetical protein
MSYDIKSNGPSTADYRGDLERPGVTFHTHLVYGRDVRPGLVEFRAFTAKGTPRTVLMTPDEAIALATEMLRVALNEKAVMER